MLHILSFAIALTSLPEVAPAQVTTTAAVTTAAATATVDDPIAEMLGKAVVIWCRPSSLEHGITMLSSNWSQEADFTTITARFRWYGLWSETPYTSKIRIDLFTGGAAPKVTSIGYKDDCLTPCKLCEQLDDVRDTLNEMIRNTRD